MKVSGAFLVNTKNFDSIISALVEHNDEEKPTINADLLEQLGYSDPNDLLLIRLLKDLNIVDNEGNPAEHYEEFRNPNTTGKALAKGLFSANETLFEKYPEIYQYSPEKIQKALKELFQGDKTDLIIKYIANTFHKVVTYVGVRTIEKIAKGEVVSVAEVETVNTNGVPSDEDFSPVDQDMSSKDDSFTENSSTAGNNPIPGEDISQQNDNETDNSEEKYNHPDDQEEVKKGPISFENEESPQSPKDRESDPKHKMDSDPFELNIPLKEATLNKNLMNTTKVKEHEFVRKALLRKSDLLHKMGHWEDLLPTLEEIIKRYDNDQQPPNIKEAISRAIIRRATTLLKLDRDEDALPALDTVINRFKNSENQHFYDQASRAMLYKAQVLEDEGYSELLPLYNAIIARLDGNSEILMNDKLDQIHIKRFDLIIEEGEDNQILDASSQLVKRFKDTSKHQDYVQKAMIIRAELLDKMNRDEEALEAYNEFLEIFDN